MKLVVLDGHTLNPGNLYWNPLRESGKFEVYDRTAGAEILLKNNVPLSKETLDQLGFFNFISATATGYDMVDVAASGKRWIKELRWSLPSLGMES